MSDIKLYVETLLAHHKIQIALKKDVLFNEFVQQEMIVNAVKEIKQNQQFLMDKWQLKNSIDDIAQQQIIIPNATVNKKYTAIINLVKIGNNEIIYANFEGLENVGLQYNYQTETIQGIPTKSGDFNIKMLYRVNGEKEDAVLNEKSIALIINADPKSLWKNIPSTKTDKNFWKEDNINAFQKLGDKHIVVASKRGRSHGNVGSFRDDDYAFKQLADTGWSIVCVSDGAGSATISRQGSAIACNEIIHYFEENLKEETLLHLDTLLSEYNSVSKNKDAESINIIKTENNINNINVTDTITPKNGLEAIQKKIKLFLYNNLGQAALKTHQKLEEFANKNEVQIKDLHSTLIFTLFKKYSYGYAILSFGVGDCPIAVLNKNKTEITLLNWLDVGEYGGGTRFITMPEIFSSDKFITRFNFKFLDDFSYLFLMTDGIYDPKFMVEANLEKTENWLAFLEDLQGKNEDNAKVYFNIDNKEIASQLSTWMDFWSPGNHDDRTLAIVF